MVFSNHKNYKGRHSFRRVPLDGGPKASAGSILEQVAEPAAALVWEDYGSRCWPVGSQTLLRSPRLRVRAKTPASLEQVTETNVQPRKRL
jgi:hypothetical protein